MSSERESARDVPPREGRGGACVRGRARLHHSELFAKAWLGSSGLARAWLSFTRDPSLPCTPILGSQVPFWQLIGGGEDIHKLELLPFLGSWVCPTLFP